MNDRGALEVREEDAPGREREVGEQKSAEERVQDPGVGSQEAGGGEQEFAEIAEETLAPALSQGERERNAAEGVPYSATEIPRRAQLAERIRQSEALPAGLRTRLAELVLAEDGAAGEQAVRAVEAALPFALRTSVGQIARPAHPGGETFFHGDADAVSDQAAEALARGQLARSGMLRGQRARVAE